MKTFFLLIVFFAAGHSKTFSTDHYDTLEQCNAAKVAIINQFKDYWSGPEENEIFCIPIKGN